MDYTVQKERLETRLSALSAGVLSGQGLSALSQAEAGRAETGRTEPGGRRISAILTALDRLNAGDYGYCRICGADIATDHLKAHPESPFCESCSTA
ncbi:conjugal transfer protein TraR [Phaeobacter sp. HF9A]|uniref:TraR/DksA family transcriptional regulator n=1 Tax=Phaeobacter sp. HF9A TaxID=2721561 RepID=UPI00143087F8|nr:conjugal transfer protein TraR [Phaeobacter sp. HF9A]NIZ14409.1 conjugal transfer protein TraR [Phaeobacter sp. HF9A]